MMTPLALFWLSLSCLSLSALAGPSLRIDSSLGKVVAQCKTKGASRQVWIFKQWHLGSATNTKEKTDFKKFPQEKNQTAIYRQLDGWVEKGQIREIYAEGCSGEINSNATLIYNGWNIAGLKKASIQSFYAEILTNVPLKIEAKYGKAVLTLCGDDPQLVKENALAFSDARGTLGFLTRIVKYKNDSVRMKPYLLGVVDSYKMPTSTTPDQAIEKLKDELKGAVKRTKDAIEKRNMKLVELIKNSTAAVVAVVYGGIHSAGIMRLLDDARIGCSIVEPIGYQDDEALLMQNLDSAIQAL